MLPQGGVWQQFRQRALDTVPFGTLVPYRSPPRLEEWLNTGAFTVTHANAKRFTLDASTLDIGSALFADASFHLDHALEHSFSMRHILASGRWYSSAWSAVLLYYWAFFLVIGLTRLLGKTAWFVSATGATFLRGLAPLGVPAPGQGAYILELGPITTVSQREVILRRGSQSRVHDLIWTLWFKELRTIIQASTITKSQDAERRLYVPLVTAANALGDAWPSALRNLLNYSPGLGYGTVRGITPAAVFGMIQTDPSSTLDNVVDRLEVNVAALISRLSLNDQIRNATRVLVDMCIVLDVIATALINEVSDRRNLDGRWRDARQRFFNNQAVVYVNRAWPCQT